MPDGQSNSDVRVSDKISKKLYEQIEEFCNTIKYNQSKL